MSNRLEPFERADVVYKTLNDIPFEAAIVVPKTSIASQNHARPLLVHFHGGGLIMGTTLDPVMLPHWLMQFGASQDAVVVSPEYRLLPEASGSDILDDVAQFWDWIHNSLPSILSERWPGLLLDLDRIAAAGESAGGFLALQSATLFPTAGIRLVMAQYCAIDVDNPAYNPAPIAPPTDDHLQTYMESVNPGSIRLSSPFPEKWDLVQAILNAGRHREVIGPDERMNIRKNIRRAEKLPAIWIAQGIHDAIMPKPVVDDFVAYIRETHPGTPLLYSVQPGGHGFDVAHTQEKPWVVEGVEFARKYWVSGTTTPYLAHPLAGESGVGG
ncbi:Alpha/Beta hydrolase protein [Ilyonectria destructans]|nr:Alpha/Beta hydrolase protein [Ilyonectria destructans]